MTADKGQTPIRLAAGDLLTRLRERSASWQKQNDEWVARIHENHPGSLDPETEAIMRTDLHGEAADTIATLTAQLAAAEARVAVAAEALEPLAKLSSDAEWDDVPDSARADVVYRSEAGGEESVGTIAFADFRRARAALRTLTQETDNAD